jgi:hypothetical protein
MVRKEITYRTHYTIAATNEGHYQPPWTGRGGEPAGSCGAEGCGGQIEIHLDNINNPDLFKRDRR